MIDVNGTRYYLFLGHDDWRRCHAFADATSTDAHDCHYDIDHHVVTLTPRLFEFPASAQDLTFVVDADRRGATRDRYGHWYWIGPDATSLRVRWSQAHTADHYWSSGVPQTCQPTAPTSSPFQPATQPSSPTPEQMAGLAATTGHYLVAGLPHANALLVFDLHTGGAPMHVALPPSPTPQTLPGATTNHALFDLAPLANGGVAVLDRVNRVVWLLDATLRPQRLPERIPGTPLAFQPKAPTGDEQPRTTPDTFVAQSIQLSDAVNPVSIEPLPDGSILLLDRAEATFATVRRYLPGGTTAVASVPLQEEALRPADSAPLQLLPIQGYDMAFVPVTGNAPVSEEGIVAGTLYVVNDAGNQAVALTVLWEPQPGMALTLRVQPTYYPMRGFTGKALVTPLQSSTAYFDHGDQWLPLVALPRKRYAPREMIAIPPLDGKEPSCVWHRLCLDACIPPDTQVRIESRAADTEEMLQWQAWQPEPALYLRHTGAEVPYASLWSVEESTAKHTGTWELLLQQAHGRYLELRLELIGNERSTPKLRALRVHYPRFSYRDNYLPDVYQQDAASAHFVESFLANPEGLLTTLEGLIVNVQCLFDVRTVPADALDWLANWLGLVFDPTWSDYQRRLLIANAPYFFLRRGTLPGLYQAILLALCPEMGPAIFDDAPVLESTPHRSTIRVVERFRTRGQRSVALGDPTNAAADTAESNDVVTHAHNFTVLLPTTLSSNEIALVDRLVALEKPAHTIFTIKQYWALFRVGEVRLGLDTVLGEGGRFTWIHLGDTALAEGKLAAAYPFSLTDRAVLAR
jgi:phage tail-like protein